MFLQKGCSRVRIPNSDRFEIMNNTNDLTTPIDDRFYRLVDRIPVRCTLMEYAAAMQDDANRIVAQSTVDTFQISTVFNGIDQNWGGDKPILFETAVFGLPDDLQPRWYFSTWDEAMETHNRLLASLTEQGAEPLIAEVKAKAGKGRTED
jgi:hypothetical protein